jgi:hypothetical protein
MAASRNSRYPNRPSAETYRRRRIIALVLVIAVIAFVWWGVASIVTGISNLFNPPSTSNSQTTTTDAAAACAPGAITIEAVVANKDGSPATSFVAASPYIGYKVTNTSSTDCTFDVGAARTFYTITSGSETIWSSKDCADRAGLTNKEMVIKAGETLSSPLDTWDMVYSSPETGCRKVAGQKDVAAGGASYHLQAEVGGVLSSADVQFLLN